MRSGIILMVSVFAVWLGLEGRAEACSCVIPDLNRDFENADHVVRVRVVSPLTAARGERRYLGVTVGESFKGCLGERAWVVVKTGADSGACGVVLQAGTEYLLFAQDGGKSRFGFPVLTTGLCSGNEPWSEVSEADRTFLGSRFVCCGDECSCNDGNEVECFVNPCDASSCNVEGAVCSANYCGGCSAEWIDPTGARVCIPQDVCDDPERSYVATSPEQCQLVKFVCVAGQEAFFDDCGCGCALKHPTIVEPCRVGGCSSELCIGPDDGEGISTCIFRPEFACYRGATCEPQPDATCGWTATPELTSCIDAAREAPTP